VKFVRSIGTVAVAGAAILGSASAASADVSTDPVPPRTVQSVQTNVAARIQHITTKVLATRVRVTANPRLAVTAKTTIQADITKVLTDVGTWRTQIAAATTMAGINAAAPARTLVIADLAKLRTDLLAARGAAAAAPAPVTAAAPTTAAP
jgi:hypothetical protein